jgi:CspA family cold shock protein
MIPTTPVVLRRGHFVVEHPHFGRKVRMEKGKVKFFNISKGFGFITMEGQQDVFFHKNNVKNTGFRSTLGEGDLVEFELKIEQKGKRAYNISRI